jgi:bifunctional UDP-N-acetylglucosamine pyrophosphorylase/glucosamine-1-phosphate N-acetyltransferase
MQCVILAAGKGTRLKPLTDTTPKPLVLVAGKPLLDHVVGALPPEVTELIIVTGYLEEQIRAYCGTEYLGRTVTYVHQEEQKGTAHALWLAQELLHDRFLLMFADDIHGATDLARAVTYPRSILVAPTETPERFGIVTTHDDGTLASIVEKPEVPPSNLASTGVMVLDTHIFKFPVGEEKNGELYLTDVIQSYAATYPMMVVEQHQWIPIGYPADITNAENLLPRDGILIHT